MVDAADDAAKAGKEAREAAQNAETVAEGLEGNADFPQTEQQWAFKQIYKKGSNRIDTDTPALRQAVEGCLDKLRAKYPEYNFSAIYGGN